MFSFSLSLSISVSPFCTLLDAMVRIKRIKGHKNTSSNSPKIIFTLAAFLLVWESKIIGKKYKIQKRHALKEYLRVQKLKESFSKSHNMTQYYSIFVTSLWLLFPASFCSVWFCSVLFTNFVSISKLETFYHKFRLYYNWKLWKCQAIKIVVINCVIYLENVLLERRFNKCVPALGDHSIGKWHDVDLVHR